MRASSKSPRAFFRGIHSPTVTHDSSGPALVTLKFPISATLSGSFTPSPTSGSTTRSVDLISRRVVLRLGQHLASVADAAGRIEVGTTDDDGIDIGG